MTLKSPSNLYAPPSLIHMTTMIRKHTKFAPTAMLAPGKPVHQARLFTATWLTLDHCQEAASLAPC